MLSEPSSIDAIGPYRILRPLGKGGMGAVYLAHDTQLNRNVAIKQLLADDNDPGFATLKKRFLREAQSAANLNHPNIVTIYHIGEHAGQPYIVMEHVDGGSWAQHIRGNGPVPWPIALAAARDAAAGLAAAHAAGIIHRDVKPANLMRRRPDAAGACLTKIVDFGLARAALPDAELTHPGAFIGSPSYVSPEQADCRIVDARSDIYSLSCTLFALLTGKPPFVADDPAEILEHHRQTPLPRLAEILPAEVPAAVEEILRRMAAKKPEERFPTAAAVIRAIDQLPLEAFSSPVVTLARTSPPVPAQTPISHDVSPATPPPYQEKFESFTPSPVPHAASTSLEELHRRLEGSRAAGDRLAERDTHVSLFHLYSRLNKPHEATHAARRALTLHLRLANPHQN